MIIGPGKISAAHTALPPPLPKKPSVVSAHVGGPLPIPSKGIRKPPPAVPARYIQAAVVSPITESSSSTSSSDGAGTVVDSSGAIPSPRRDPKSNVAMKSRMFEAKAQQSPPQVPFRSTSYNAGAVEGVSRSKIEIDKNAMNVIGNGYSLDNEISRRGFTLAENGGTSGGGYSIQEISHGSDSSTSSTSSVLLTTRVDSAKVEEALREISGFSKSAPPTNFGHSRIDVTSSTHNSIDRVVKDTSPWDSIVDSWIKETDNGALEDDIVASALTESFKRSHKNPFLADLNCGKDGADLSRSVDLNTDEFKAMSNSFSFCVDSPAFTTSSGSGNGNGSTTNSTASSTVTVMEKSCGSGDEANSSGNYNDLK